MKYKEGFRKIEKSYRKLTKCKKKIRNISGIKTFIKMIVVVINGCLENG